MGPDNASKEEEFRQRLIEVNSKRKNAKLAITAGDTETLPKKIQQDSAEIPGLGLVTLWQQPATASVEIKKQISTQARRLT